MRAVALLSWWQLKNSIRALLLEPKKLIPFLFLVLVGGFNLFIWFSVSHDGRAISGPGAQFLEAHPSEGHAIVFAAAALLSLVLISAGFTGRAITFAPEDVDWLFPAPVPRRVALAFRLPALVFSNCYIVFFAVVLAVPMVGGPVMHGRFWFLVLAGGVWLAFYVILAVAAEAAFGLRHAAPVSRALPALGALLLAWGGLAYGLFGFQGLASLERNPLFVVLFYPCRLLADVALAPLAARGTVLPMLQLALLCVAAAWLALSRRENFYEATLAHSERVAAVRRAMRGGDQLAAWSAILPRRPARDYERSYALRPFGRGAGAILWAHLTALAKRPLVHFVGPFGLAFGVSAGVMFWKHGEAAPMMARITIWAFYWILFAGARDRNLKSVRRMPLLAPLPLKAWKLVAADVSSSAIQGTLIAWGAALPLFAGGPDERLLGGLLLVAAPPVLGCALLVAYAVAFWYPNLADKPAQLVSSLVMMAMLGGLTIFLLPFILPPVLMGHRALLLLTLPVGGLLACAGLLPITARAFANAEP